MLFETPSCSLPLGAAYKTTFETMYRFLLDQRSLFHGNSHCIARSLSLLSTEIAYGNEHQLTRRHLMFHLCQHFQLCFMGIVEINSIRIVRRTKFLESSFNT
jgi:hypothetical protein